MATERMDLFPAEQARRGNNGLLIGTIAEVDTDKARVRVQTGESLTGWLPWLTARAGGERTWSAPDVGEQVLLGTPDGDLARAVVLGALFQSAHPAPANSADIHRFVFADGAYIEYDTATHRLKARIPGHAQVTAVDAVTIIGNPIHLNP